MASVDKWFFKDVNNPEAGITSYGIGENTIGGGQYGTVKKLEPQFAINKICEIDSRSDLYKAIKQELIENMETEKIQTVISLLKYKKQIILQGPPVQEKLDWRN